MFRFYVPLSLAPGEAFQFDWSHEIAVINGVTMPMCGHYLFEPTACTPAAGWEKG